MKKIRSILILTGITLILLLLLEIFLRIFFPPRVNSTEQVAAFQYHPEYLVGLKPGMKKSYVRSERDGGDTIFWATNKEGFRGRDLIQRDLRIMVYGDSNIQARFTRLSHTYPYYLEKFINEASKNTIEVINAGVVGFGPDQSLLKFIEEKETFKPDIVILQIFADNDYGDIIRNKLFTVASNGRLAKTQNKRCLDPALKAYLDRNNPFGYLRIMDAVKKVRRSIKKEAIIDAERMIQLCSTLCKKEFQSYIGESREIYSHFADHYDIDVATEPLSVVSEKKIALMDKILEEFKKVAIMHQIKLLILIEPSSVDISTNSYMNYRDLQNRFPEYDPRNLTKLIENSCVKYGIPYIDLYDTFSDNGPEQLYFSRGNDHWNDKAQKLAAKVTSEFILKELSE